MLQGKTVAVVGFGSQGHAHSLNLRDSGVKVIVANRRDSTNGKLALEHGFDPLSVEDAVKAADHIIVTLPDEVQPEVYNKSIAPKLKAGKALGATHGFNIHFKTIVPPKDVDVLLVAPKGPGHLVRSEFEKAQRVLTTLFEYVITHPREFFDDAPHPGPLSPGKDARSAGEGIERLAIDFIAGMTDRYAINLYERLFVPKARV